MVKSKDEIELEKRLNSLFEQYWDNPTIESYNAFKEAEDNLIAYQKVSCWNNIKGIVYA